MSRSRLRKVIHEAHRRSLWQVLAIYLAGSWVALQVVDLLAEHVGLPSWFPSLAVALLVIGLPIVLATAFVQEGGPSQEEGERPPDEGAPASPGRGAEEAPEAPGGAGESFRRLLTWRNAIAGGVLAFALWGVVAAGWILLAGSPGTEGADASSLGPAPLLASERQTAASVAVLPFDDISAGEETRFFTDGVHDEVLAQLSKIGDLRVISRTSVLRYRDTEKSVRQIGKELGVDAILEGSVRRAGDQVRITTQLIDPRSDAHLWTETYDRELEGIFQVQSDIAQRVAGALEATLSPEEESRIERRPTESLEAYDLYLKGRERYREYEPEENEEAIRLFERALELDPEYALAWAGLGDAYGQRVAKFGYPTTWADSAAAAARRAVELDPELAEGYKALGLALTMQGQLQEALTPYRRAVELDPNHDGAINNIGVIYSRLDRFAEALRWYERSFHLDPNNPFARTNIAWSYIRMGDLARAERWIRDARELEPDAPKSLAPWSYLALVRGRFDAAVERIRRVVELHPESALGHTWVAGTAHFARRHDLAERHGREARSLAPSADLFYGHTPETVLGFALLERGEQAEGREKLREALGWARELLESGWEEVVDVPWEIAAAQAALGNREKALAWLERAYEAGFREYRRVELDPVFDDLRDEPRFRDTVERMRADVREMYRGVEERQREAERR